MFNIIKFELKRGFKSGTFLISLLLGCSISIVEFGCYYCLYAKMPDLATVIQGWLGTNFQLLFNNLFYLLLPLFAAIPYGASYFSDLRSGYIKNICVKTSRKEYFTAKSIAVFCTAAAAVMIPLVLNFVLFMRVFPLRIPEKLLFYGGTVDAYLFADVYYNSSLTYAIIFTLIDGLAAGIISLFSVCVADFCDSGFIAVTTPFVVYILTGFLFGNGGEGNFSLLDMLNPKQVMAADESRLFSMLGIMLLVAVVWIVCKARKRDIL
ncbi:MAG: hypothetical protein ACI39R_02490 [Lachnospiraceae bacterium]